jgi:hypothetical protein
LNAERTVVYEYGLRQRLIRFMDTDFTLFYEVTLFYKDIHRLLSMDVITTYNQVRYGLYANEKYCGNARGIEVKYGFDLSGFNFIMNYTLQNAQGTADNPIDSFIREGNSQEPISGFIPLSWDQRHTLNLLFGYNARNLDVTLSNTIGSGLRFTYTPIAESPLGLSKFGPNNGRMPGTFNSDLFVQYKVGVVWTVKLKATLTVYNLFDRMNELNVNGVTGRANQAVVRPSDLAMHRSDFNDYYDRINNPTSFSAPRLIKLGLGIEF